MVAVLGGLWLLGGSLTADPAPPKAAAPDPSPQELLTGPLTGRIVYSTFESDGPLDRQQQLWAFDLATGRLTEGPLVPTVEELVAIGPDRSSILFVSDLGRAGGAAYMLEDFAADSVPVEVARGDLLSVSNQADAVVAARTEPIVRGGCPGSRYVITRFSSVTGVQREVARGRIRCGRLLSVAGVGSRVYASLLRDGRPETDVVARGRLRPTRSGPILVSAGPDGSWLTVGADGRVVRPFGVWPGTPTGPLSVSSPPPPSDGSSAVPRVRDVGLFAERTVAWSRDGRAVVVSGIIDDDRSMWLVRVDPGTATELLPPNSVPLRSAFSGASFDAAHALFIGSPGSIVVETREGRSLLPLPPDAPSPAGPIAWLP